MLNACGVCTQDGRCRVLDSEESVKAFATHSSSGAINAQQLPSCCLGCKRRRRYINFRPTQLN